MQIFADVFRWFLKVFFKMALNCLSTLRVLPFFLQRQTFLPEQNFLCVWTQITSSTTRFYKLYCYKYAKQLFLTKSVELSVSIRFHALLEPIRLILCHFQKGRVLKPIRYKNRAEWFALNENQTPVRYEFQNDLKPIRIMETWSKAANSSVLIWSLCIKYRNFT